MQIFEKKTGQKTRFWALFGKFAQKKLRFLARAFLKISIYWRQKRF